MNAKRSSVSTPSIEIIDQRYRVERTLGRGGVAIVYQVFDTQTDQVVALKQLLPKDDPKRRKEIRELFEYEFQTLTQLAHPGVVRVYTYGTGHTDPYYTMELLDGGDLNKIAPLGWKQACALLLEVCSALGLLHSRRQVHRDLSPRNIRCTLDQKAKLMDFGAIAPMGPSRALIGTPAFTAPEVVGYQTLDARTDIYSLGSTFYYLLTGSSAYPAKEFNQLSDLWQWTPPAPSERVEGIPTELDNLVMSMISLDPMSRPVNAIEVMERLSAIAELDIDDRLVVSKSYLSTPNLVGRERQLERIQHGIDRAHRGEGATIVIEGKSGQGRSRLLDAIVLRGKLSGAAIVKVSATESRTGSFSGLRSVAFQLFDALPSLAIECVRRHIPVLSQVFPDIVSRIGHTNSQTLDDLNLGIHPNAFNDERSVYGRTFGRRDKRYPSEPPRPSTSSTVHPQSPDDAHKLRQQVHEAMREWLIEIASKQCIIIAVDDLHQIDEPSAAFMALFSQNLYDSKLLLAVTVDTDDEASSSSAIALLKNSGKRIRLKPLSPEQTENLCSSIFGDTANLRLVANKLYSISKGNPRTVMLLAQHLLDRDLIRHQRGSWVLPDSIKEDDLPNSLSETLKAQINEFSTEVLHLARILALRPKHSFSFQECQILTDHRSTTGLVQNLDELVACGILTTNGAFYGFSNQGWIPILIESWDDASKKSGHMKMAEVFENRKNEQFRTAQHYLEAEQQERALNILIRFSRESKELTSKDPGTYTALLESLPRGWLSTLKQAIALAKTKGRDKKEVYILLSRLSGLLSNIGSDDIDYLIELLDELYHATALEDYQKLGDSVPAQERLGLAFKLAQERYDATDDSQRVMAPSDAVRALVGALIEAVGVVYNTDNLGLWRKLPSVEPLTVLSPAVWIVHKLVSGHGKGIMGCVEQLYHEDLAIIERLDQPDRAGLEGAHYLYLRYPMMLSLGNLEAMMGLKGAIARVAEVESSQILQVNAWRIRRIYYLWQASAMEADECQKQIELLQIQNNPSRYFPGRHLSPELAAFSLSDDLLGVKRLINDIKKMAQEVSAYLPVLHFAYGEYYRIRGDLPRALDELQKAMEFGPCGQHPNWVYAASAYLRTLLQMKREEQARTDGETFLEAARQADLGYLCNYLIMPLAIAQSELGNHDKATQYADSVIESFINMGTTGLNLGLAYETRARVAISANDSASYEQSAERCVEHLKVGSNPVLTARHQRLKSKARKALGKNFRDPELANSMESDGGSSTTLVSQMHSELVGCVDAADRAGRLLDILIEKCDSFGGFLYSVKDQNPVFMAQRGDFPRTTVVEKMVLDRFSSEISFTTGESTSAGRSEIRSEYTYDDFKQKEFRYRTLIIGHYSYEGFAVTGVAVLVTDPDKKYKHPTNILMGISKILLQNEDSSAVYPTG